MFTQCPECSTGFRVTAKVLQQAGGRVRCGGCGHAFSALEHLTEEMPGGGKADKSVSAAPAAAEADSSELTSEEKFKETSKQLLQTLSELTGADEVRIEDTGIEWHVVDEEDIEDEDDESEKEASATLEALVGDDEDSGEFLELEQVGEGGEQEAELGLADDEETDLAASGSDESSESLTDDEDTAAGDDIPLEVEEELAAIHSELSSKEEKVDEQPEDLDSQFEMQAEAMGIDISGAHATLEEDDEAPAEEADADQSADMEIDAALAGELLGEGASEDVEEEDDSADDAEESPVEDEQEIEVATDEQGEDADVDEEDDEEQIAAALTPDADEDEEGDEEQIAAAFTPDADVIELSMASGADEQAEPEYTGSDDLPEPSEEELTINQEIDQELLAVASQDEDLRATIVGLDSLEKEIPEKETDDEESDDEEEVPAAGVETIIMEGDQIRGAFEREREQERREAALKRFDKAGNLIDSYVARRIVRSGKGGSYSLNYGMIAGVLLLVFFLAGQVVHANRQALSTSGIFNSTVGQVYRLLGNPITPEWSITGWQFEATNGSIAEDDDVLTILSRIGNRSEQSLPYPLVHVSLTDRWEDIIGSAILEPGDYLAADLNPNQPVFPGDNFTAVITIDEPSVDATGFKLNVCYRVSTGRVRCATEDFKD